MWGSGFKLFCEDCGPFLVTYGLGLQGASCFGEQPSRCTVGLLLRSCARGNVVPTLPESRDAF